MGKKVLIVGKGGREHAFAWKLKQSPLVEKVYSAPGNPGTALIGENISIEAADARELLTFAERNHIDLTVVGPEEALFAGIVDLFRAHELSIVGPTKNASRIEFSKVFAKRFMVGRGIPTAAFRDFRRYQDALNFIEQYLPKVVKADGPALGKGVELCFTLDQAKEALHDFLVKGVHGESGRHVVIEELLHGDELSAHALCDGIHAPIQFPLSRDSKFLNGKSTGGMGTFTPVPGFGREYEEWVNEYVVAPALAGLRERESPFTGCLYPGLKLSRQGIKVLEFNVRPGDPEWQSYMRLLKSDLVPVLASLAEGSLDRMPLEWHQGFAVCVVIASPGYPNPGATRYGIPIGGIREAEQVPGVVVFHAGTRRNSGALESAGGRVLNVTALGSTLEEARERAYAGIEHIVFPGMQYRKDIGLVTTPSR